MSEINYQALREAAQNAKNLGGIKNYKRGEQAVAEFKSLITPHIVLALLDEREAKDKVWSAQDNHINQQADRIESLEKKNGELGRALEAAEKRIAELEAREIKPAKGEVLHCRGNRNRDEGYWCTG